MRLLVSGATSTLSRLATRHADVLGYLVVPGARNTPAAVQALGLPYAAADNGCFKALDPGGFAAMLATYRAAGVRLEWVAVPDVVADAVQTWRRWQEWHPVVRAFGFRPAMVLQDGMTLDAMFDFDPPAVFVGGTDAYKEGRDARVIVHWARSKCRPAHMGRVNTQARVDYAVAIGCTSIDGTGASRWPDAKIPNLCRWVREAIARETHPRLFADNPARAAPGT